MLLQIMSSRQKKLILAAAVVLSVLLSSCSAEGNVPDETRPYYAFTDSTGRSVVLDSRPERIAILFSSYAEVWVTAGGSVDITVGESVERGFADESAVLVDEGSGHTTIDLERLVYEKPDLVIGTADYECQMQACDFCMENGIPAASFRVEHIDDYLNMLDIFCSITGNRDSYAIYGESVRAEADAVLDSALAETAAPDILFIRAGTSARATKAKASDDNFVCRMLAELGANNIADAAPVLLDSLSLEEIILADPDHIFITTMGDEAAARDFVASLLSESGWRSLLAVRNGNVHFLEKDSFHYKPNARWADAYSHLAGILYPEAQSENKK